MTISASASAAIVKLPFAPLPGEAVRVDGAASNVFATLLSSAESSVSISSALVLPNSLPAEASQSKGSQPTPLDALSSFLASFGAAAEESKPQFEATVANGAADGPSSRTSSRAAGDRKTGSNVSGISPLTRKPKRGDPHDSVLNLMPVPLAAQITSQAFDVSPALTGTITAATTQAFAPLNAGGQPGSASAATTPATPASAPAAPTAPTSPLPLPLAQSKDNQGVPDYLSFLVQFGSSLPSRRTVSHVALRSESAAVASVGDAPSTGPMAPVGAGGETQPQPLTPSLAAIGSANDIGPEVSLEPATLRRNEPVATGLPDNVKSDAKEPRPEAKDATKDVIELGGNDAKKASAKVYDERERISPSSGGPQAPPPARAKRDLVNPTVQSDPANPSTESTTSVQSRPRNISAPGSPSLHEATGPKGENPEANQAKERKPSTVEPPEAPRGTPESAINAAAAPLDTPLRNPSQMKAPSPSAPPQLRPQPPSNPPTGAAASQIAIRLDSGNDSGQVELRIRERAGEVQIAVRSTDQGVATALRQDLGDLVRRLEPHAASQESTRPEASATESSTASHVLPNAPGADPSRGFSYFSDDSQQHRQRQQQQQQQNRQPAISPEASTDALDELRSVLSEFNTGAFSS